MKFWPIKDEFRIEDPIATKVVRNARKTTNVLGNVIIAMSEDFILNLLSDKNMNWNDSPLGVRCDRNRGTIQIVIEDNNVRLVTYVIDTGRRDSDVVMSLNNPALRILYNSIKKECVEKRIIEERETELDTRIYNPVKAYKDILLFKDLI